MQIARYKEDYQEEVVNLIQMFFDESVAGFGLTIDYDTIIQAIEKMKDEGYLLVKDDTPIGLIVGKETRTPTSDERVWHEVMWYVRPEYRSGGVRLLKEVSHKLKERGFDLMVMVALEGPLSGKLDKFYRRMGFNPLERHYVGRL